jgi:hypothetical protein
MDQSTLAAYQCQIERRGRALADFSPTCWW